jgi:hypothetical protein
VDFARSRGLLGARRLGGSLYLHLAGSDAHVVLAERPPPHPHVEQASCLLDGARLLPAGVTVTASGHGARVIVFAGFPPGAALVVSRDGAEEAAQADATGRLEVRLAGPGETAVAVRTR